MYIYVHVLVCVIKWISVLFFHRELRTPDAFLFEVLRPKLHTYHALHAYYTSRLPVVVLIMRDITFPDNLSVPLHKSSSPRSLKKRPTPYTETSILRCVKSQKSADRMYTAEDAWHHVYLFKDSAVTWEVQCKACGPRAYQY